MAANRGCRQLRLTRALPSTLRPAPLRFCAESYSTTPIHRQDAFRTQLESAGSPTLFSYFDSPAPSQPQTLTEKIIQRYSVGLAPGKKVKAGDYVTLKPQACMTHDNSWPVATKFMAIGASKIHDNQQIIMTLDHDVQNKSESNLKKYKQIEEFASKHGVRFYPAGRVCYLRA